MIVRLHVEHVIAAAVVAAVFALMLADSASANCNTKRCELRVASKQCSQARPVPCIRYAALKYRQPFQDALRVARCESGLRPTAVGFGIHRGLFQFNWPGTWSTTPYRRRDPFTARWNALAAMWMWKVGRRGEWQCR